PWPADAIMNCADPRRGPTHYARIGLGVSNELLKSMEGRKCFTGIAGCCALATSGQAAAAPNSEMNWRRFIWITSSAHSHSGRPPNMNTTPAQLETPRPTPPRYLV